MAEENTKPRLQPWDEFWEDGIKYEVLDNPMNVEVMEIPEGTTNFVVPTKVMHEGNRYDVTKIQIDCPSLTSIEIPQGVTYLSLNCPSLTSLEIPSSVEDMKLQNLENEIPRLDLSHCVHLDHLELLPPINSETEIVVPKQHVWIENNRMLLKIHGAGRTDAPAPLLNVVPTDTVADLKKAFQKVTSGGILRVYNEEEEADDGTPLMDIGGRSFQLALSGSVGDIEEALLKEAGLKTRIYNMDSTTAIRADVPVQAAAYVPSNATDEQMAQYKDHWDAFREARDMPFLAFKVQTIPANELDEETIDILSRNIDSQRFYNNPEWHDTYLACMFYEDEEEGILVLDVQSDDDEIFEDYWRLLEEEPERFGIDTVDDYEDLTGDACFCVWNMVANDRDGWAKECFGDWSEIPHEKLFQLLTGTLYEYFWPDMLCNFEPSYPVIQGIICLIRADDNYEFFSTSIMEDVIPLPERDDLMFFLKQDDQKKLAKLAKAPDLVTDHLVPDPDEFSDE